MKKMMDEVQIIFDNYQKAFAAKETEITQMN